MIGSLNAISTIGVKDLQVSRDFYEKTLGLTPIESGMPDEVQLLKCGNTQVELYHSDFAGTNKATALSFVAGDGLEKEVDALKKKGVTFEHYQFDNLKMEGDIHVMGDMRAAWFKDPDGNILCIANH